MPELITVCRLLVIFSQARESAAVSVVLSTQLLFLGYGAVGVARLVIDSINLLASSTSTSCPKYSNELCQMLNRARLAALARVEPTL